MAAAVDSYRRLGEVIITRGHTDMVFERGRALYSRQYLATIEHDGALSTTGDSTRSNAGKHHALSNCDLAGCHPHCRFILLACWV